MGRRHFTATHSITEISILLSTSLRVILDTGVQEYQRGSPVAVQLPDPQDPSNHKYCFLAVTTMVEAFYVAKERALHNENI